MKDFLDKMNNLADSPLLDDGNRVAARADHLIDLQQQRGATGQATTTTGANSLTGVNDAITGISLNKPTSSPQAQPGGGCHD